MTTDTIFAMASGGGRAAISVLRLSGDGSGPMLDVLCHKRPPPRRASVRTLRTRDGTLLDHAMVLWLPGPGSYTGEDSAELHLHGGRAVRNAVADELLRLGSRPAEPGEFTRRAFLNGRVDLLQAEAVADLVEAETEAQRRQALQQLGGAQSALYRGWADRLQFLLAEQEALIDFPDEDLAGAGETMRRDIAALQAEIGAYLDDDGRGERLREGLTFAIVGPPNVGKSSLLNALAGQDVAIVAPSPGTTRDVVEARLDLAGLPVTLIDTAGLRETEDPVEAEGVRRTRRRAEAADLVLLVSDASRFEPTEAPCGPPVLAIANKIDIAPVPAGTLGVSARTGEGLDALRRALAAAARNAIEGGGSPPLTRARHRAALAEVAGHLAEAKDAAWPELRGEGLRLALRGIGRITGAVGVEDILDAIFSRFCIGK